MAAAWTPSVDSAACPFSAAGESEHREHDQARPAEHGDEASGLPLLCLLRRRCQSHSADTPVHEGVAQPVVLEQDGFIEVAFDSVHVQAQSKLPNPLSFHDGVHQRFARLSLESAVAADPLWVPPQLVLALVEIRMGEGSEGLRRLEETWVLDSAVEDGRDPVLLAPVGLMEPSEMWSGIDEVVPDTLANARTRGRYGAILDAHSCFGTGSCGAAVTSLSNALAEEADDEPVRVFLAMAHMENGQWAKAVDQLREIADEDAPATVHGLLGECYAQLGMVEEARAAYAAAEQRPDRTPALQRRRAELELMVKDYGQAQSYARKARALDDDDMKSAGILLETGGAE